MKNDFLAGVIEGFYGPPWSLSERMELLEWMVVWKLNTYLYAPKDDLNHRATWRECYSTSDAERLRMLVRACGERGIRFIYALSPGLDVRYSHSDELDRVIARFEQLLALGCGDFALLFDDIPDQIHEEDRQQWGSFATAQCQLTNAVFRWVRTRRPAVRFMFCPTAYCGRMRKAQLGGAGYLETVGRELSSEIDVFWTGPDIVSREISVTHLREIQGLLRRKPLIWDNLFANDYDGRRFYCGPYSGRSPELRSELSGILCNPNTEFPLNFVPLRTFASYLQNEVNWDARAAYVAAMSEWLPRFTTIRGPASLETLQLLGDCYYLPHEEGPEAEKLFDLALGLLSRDPREWSESEERFCKEAVRLREFCASLANLLDRQLFYALHRRVWELREELDLLLGYVQAMKDADLHYRSDYHLPGTHRGGFVARLQRLLTFRSDGAFESAFLPAAPTSSIISRSDS